MSEITALRFLVVEDHSFQRWLICDLLRQLGATSVESVADGRSALHLLAARDFDVVVSDLEMPDVDGMQLFRLMSERGHRAGLIVLSALDPSLLGSVASMAREYGVNLIATIQKPLNAKKFEDAMASFQPLVAEAKDRSLTITSEEIAAGIRRAEFVAFYQPKADLRTGCIQGAEALVRWEHPYRGHLRPGAFLAAVEEAGFIDELTVQVARQAFSACRQWRDLGRDIGVSVNLSALSLSDLTLADRMSVLATDAGADPRKVTLEITESAAARNMGPKLENLTRLRMRGFELSIDDFGTGFSSLQRLSQLPFTELKVDQGFVSKAVQDSSNRILVESSLDLAHRLGIRAVAEGVESRAQWEMLLGLGCPTAQGYFIAQPMSPEEFLSWLEARQENCA